MDRKHRPAARLVAVLSLCSSFAWGANPSGEAPEPGPEDGGLRLRFVIAPRADNEDGFDVRLDLLNTTDRDVTLRTAWRDDQRDGDVGDYIEAATSIECVPAIAPWIGGVQQGQRTSPQAEHLLKAHDILTSGWKTRGRHLKNVVTDPNQVQNPEFPFPGLYSVHATVTVITSERKVRLRSNEQLVSVGGSRSMPKYTYAPLLSVHPDVKTALLGLGSVHKVERGDQFEIGSPKGTHWRLTITEVDVETSTGSLETLTHPMHPAYSTLPHRLSEATLVQGQ